MIDLLVLDVGNTTVTAASMAGGDVVGRAVFTHDVLADLEGLARFASAVACDLPVALASVNEAATARILPRIGLRPVLLSPRDFDPRVENCCDPPDSVGQDRLFNAAGVRTLPAVVVDAGTAITVDLVTPGKDGVPVFRGGAIAPGVALSFRALHERTGRLPWVRPELERAEPDRAGEGVPRRGENTEDALLCGVVRGLAGLVDRLAEDVVFGVDDPNPGSDLEGAERRAWVTVITGGDAALLAPYLGVAAEHDPDVMLRGIARSASTRPGATG